MYLNQNNVGNIPNNFDINNQNITNNPYYTNNNMGNSMNNYKMYYNAMASSQGQNMTQNPNQYNYNVQTNNYNPQNTIMNNYYGNTYQGQGQGQYSNYLNNNPQNLQPNFMQQYYSQPPQYNNINNRMYPNYNYYQNTPMDGVQDINEVNQNNINPSQLTNSLNLGAKEYTPKSLNLKKV